MVLYSTEPDLKKLHVLWEKIGTASSVPGNPANKPLDYQIIKGQK